MFIIDIQGFHFPQTRKFTCKEIAILNTIDGCVIHRFIDTPIGDNVLNYKTLNHINWVRDNIHGLDWMHQHPDVNILMHEDISNFINKHVNNNNNTTLVAVKGAEKKFWLKQFIPNEIIDLQEENCLSLPELKKIFESRHCLKHTFNMISNCAVENVFYLYDWYKIVKDFKKFQ